MNFEAVFSAAGLGPAQAPGRFRFFPRFEQSSAEHLIALVNCGYCQHSVVPHGSFQLFDAHLAIEPDSFVLLRDPTQPDFDGYSLKFLRRRELGHYQLVSEISRRRLTGQEIIATLVMVYTPDPAGGADFDRRIRALVDLGMARERMRRDQVETGAVAKWGSPCA